MLPQALSSSTPEVKEDEKVGNIWGLKVSQHVFDTSLALGVDTWR